MPDSLFPQDFAFQLTSEEAESLRSQIVTLDARGLGFEAAHVQPCYVMVYVCGSGWLISRARRRSSSISSYSDWRNLHALDGGVWHILASIGQLLEDDVKARGGHQEVSGACVGWPSQIAVSTSNR